MLKLIFISSLLLLASYRIQSQPDPIDLQKQLDELRMRIKTLEKENEILKATDKSYDSSLYCSMRLEVFESFSNISQLDFDFKNTLDKMAVTGLFTKLIQASNPSSDILGFRFTEIIFSTAEKHFLEILKNERDKKRFSQVISKIISNPIVSSLANTNPVTSVVTSIISTIAGFTTSKAELQKDGGRIKGVTIEQQDSFDKKSIIAFRDELQVYIEFYDAMIVVSNDYIKGLEYLDNKYDYLTQLVKDYKIKLYEDLEVDERNLLIKLSGLFPDPSLENVNYSDLIRDEKVRKSLIHAGKYPVMHQAVNEFKKEYNSLILKFLSDYKQILESAKDFPDHDIDKAKTDILINDIELFINIQLNNECK